jgi:hypothetical protein
MRRIITAIAVWGMVLAGGAPQTHAKDRPVNIFLNFGTEINMMPQYWSAGLQVDLHPGKLLMVSPEFNIWFGKGLTGCFLVPAVLLNLKVGRFFAGVGPAIIGYQPGGGAWEFRPKFDLGYKTRHFKLLAGAIPRNGYVSGLATVGFGF